VLVYTALILHTFCTLKKINSIVVDNQVFIVVAKDTGIASTFSEVVKLTARREVNNLRSSLAEKTAVLASNSSVANAIYLLWVFEIVAVFFGVYNGRICFYNEIR
jgi:hypothetical protein